MQQRPLLNRCLIVALFAVSACGCGGADQLKVYRVSGRVTLESIPMVGGGSITFMPLGDKNAKSAGANINDDGRYTLTTYQEGDGAVPGEYRVTITQVTVTEPENRGDGNAAAPIKPAVAEEDRIPAVYSEPDSPLTATVEERENKLDFDLKRR